MPRNLFFSDEPEVINSVIVNDGDSPTLSSNLLEVATTNENKLMEFRRILSDYEVIGKKLKVEEIQSLDPMVVASEKAKEAFKQNGYNPILVEDTSLSIKGLGGRPGTYVVDFFNEPEIRRLAAEVWLKDADRTAIAKVVLAMFDGIKVHIWEGKVIGTIPEGPRGGNGFGWDDIFVPEGETRTFAEMSDSDKDKYSMRTKALQSFVNNPVVPAHQVFQLPEPYQQELKRLQIDKLQDEAATNFAFQLECLTDNNSSNNEFTADSYSPLLSTENVYFTRYLQQGQNNSLGLILTDIDRKHIKLKANGKPELWQMGPERRKLAIAQRAEFFLEHQDPEVHKVLDDLEFNKDKFPARSNMRSLSLESALGIEGYASVTKAISLKEIGYKKISADTRVSRTHSSKYGLFNIIGKYPRSIYAVGCLPYISGWRDMIVASAISHMLVFVHRNNLNAIDFQNQVDLVNEARDAVHRLDLTSKARHRALANIGAALGSNPIEDLEKARILYNEAGVRAFRIYTINSDPRVIETAAVLRAEFGDEIEIFVGQLVDKKQCEALIAPNIRVDGLIFGHGGGRQCTSATNGMALSTLEELYEVLIDRNFNNTSVMVEGGIGSKVGGLLVMGVDCILRNGQFGNCVIEQGDVYFRHKNGKFCQPYHGSASAPTMIIESLNPENAQKKLFFSGRTRNVEGKSGYVFYQEKANSMSFYVEQFKHYAARTLADLGVKSIWELREFLGKNNQELLRLVSMDAEQTSKAYKS